MDLRRQQHALRHGVHAGGGLCPGAERARARRFPLRLDAAEDAGRPRPHPLHRLLPARDRGAALRRLPFRRDLLAHRRAFERHGRRSADLSVQDGHPHCRSAHHPAGPRRDRALRHLPAHRPMAEPAARRAGDGRPQGAARAKRACRRGNAAGAPSRARTRSKRRRGSAAWRGTCKHERSSARAGDVGPHRHHDHDGLPDRVHADGPRRVLRLLRLLRPGPILVRQPRLRSDGPAHLRRHDQRGPDRHPALRPHGLRHGTRRPRGQDVLLGAAVAPRRAGIARRHQPGRVRLLGHGHRTRRGRGRADGRRRLPADAAGRIRHAPRRRRDHGRRHARHPDPAVHHDHRLCGGRRAVGGEALRGGDVPGPLPRVSLCPVRHRSDPDKPGARPAAARGRHQDSRSGMDAEVRLSLFAQHACRARLGLVLALEGGRHRNRGRTPHLREAVQELRAPRSCLSPW